MSCAPGSRARSARDSPKSSCSYPLAPVSVFRSFTRLLATSSAKIARTGFSFARDYLPRSPIASPIFRSTDRSDLETEFEPPATDTASNGGDPRDAIARGISTGDALTLRGVEELRFVKLSDKATLPTRAHDNDAGLDLYAAEAARIVPGARVSVGTGLAVAIPDGLAGLVLPRSGLALKHGVTLANSPGLIDPGYRGEVRVSCLTRTRRSTSTASRAIGSRSCCSYRSRPPARCRPTRSTPRSAAAAASGRAGSSRAAG